MNEMKKIVALGALAFVCFFTANAKAATSPILITPTSLVQYCTIGENASTQYFQVYNTNTYLINYKIFDNVYWISENPTTGSSTGEYDTIKALYSNAGTWTGTYRGTISVTSTNLVDWSNSIPVTLIITSSPNVVIVDNADTNGVKIIGSWLATANDFGCKTNYLYDGNTNKGTKSVIFTPVLSTGIYEVSTWWFSSTNRDTNVPYDIISLDGTNTVFVNQRLNGSKWYILSTNNFSSGTNGYVRIRTDNTTNGNVIADAIKFVNIPPTTTTTTTTTTITTTTTTTTTAAINTNLCSVVLAWDAPTTNTDGTALTDLAGYKLYKGETSHVYYAVTDVGNVTNTTVTNLICNITYYFAVTAYNTSNRESAYSDELSWNALQDALPSSPSSPLILSIKYVYRNNFTVNPLNVSFQASATNLNGTYLYSSTTNQIAGYIAKITGGITTNINIISTNSNISTNFMIPKDKGMCYFSVAVSNIYGIVGPYSSTNSFSTTVPGKIWSLKTGVIDLR